MPPKTLRLLIPLVLLLLVAAAVVLVRPLRQAARAGLSYMLAVVNSRSVTQYSQGQFTNIVFLHHSTGRNLIAQGQVRQQLTRAGYTFWDHDYNYEGFFDPQGKRLPYTYNIPGDNTDPDGLAVLFAQPAYGLPVNALSGLLQHEVIVLKSCFPTSNIADEEQLARLQSYYLGMRQTMDAHPERLFILLTQPPLNPAETNLERAARARHLAAWLASDEFRAGHPNVYVFDFFDRLAEADPEAPDANMLRLPYRDGADSHPNQAANAAIGPQLVEFILQSIASYRQVATP